MPSRFAPAAPAPDVKGRGRVAGPAAGARWTPRTVPPVAIRACAWVVLLAAWELYGRQVNPTLFTHPTAVFRHAVSFIQSGELWNYAKTSLQVLAMGLTSATVVSIPFGVLMARFRFIEYWFDTYVSALYSTPFVALVPLFVLWFGIDVQAKVIIVALFAFFPILINTFQGVKNVDESLLEVSRSFCSPEARTWTDVIIPSAVPFIVTGLRLAVGRALIGMIVAEFYTSVTGLGYMIVTYANAFQTAKLFVPIILIAGLGVALTALLNYAEKRLAPWKVRG